MTVLTEGSDRLGAENGKRHGSGLYMPRARMLEIYLVIIGRAIHFFLELSYRSKRFAPPPGVCSDGLASSSHAGKQH